MISKSCLFLVNSSFNSAVSAYMLQFKDFSEFSGINKMQEDERDGIVQWFIIRRSKKRGYLKSGNNQDE